MYEYTLGIFGILFSVFIFALNINYIYKIMDEHHFYDEKIRT